MTQGMHQSVNMDSSLIDTLLDHGISVTRQRLAVARVMLPARVHCSAEEVVGALKASGEPVSKATVYNTLGLFVEKGLLRAVVIDATHTLYDSNIEPHHHCYNEQTGELIDIPAQTESAAFARLAAQYASLGDVVGVDVVVRIRGRETGSETR